MITENQLDRDILNMIAAFESDIMRNTREEDAFDRAMRRLEIEGAMDDMFGG